MHQIPPKPGYLRVKAWRKLQRLGAVAVKNTVYVLPNTPSCQEDFNWAAREIAKDGGEATVCAASFLDGLTDVQVVNLFQAARNADYAQVAEEAKGAIEASGTGDAAAASDVSRLRRRLAEIGAVDFFHADGREAAEGLVDALERRLRQSGAVAAGAVRWSGPAPRGRTWVTRAGVHVDRMGSAWLIRRFIDAEAKFRFVTGRTEKPRAGELRFDMFEAEFTHEGDLCTFEVLLARFGLDDPALVAIGEIVHDVDLKDGKFGRPEAPGIQAITTGIAIGARDDAARLARSHGVFDALHDYLRQRGR